MPRLTQTLFARLRLVGTVPGPGDRGPAWWLPRLRKICARAVCLVSVLLPLQSTLAADTSLSEPQVEALFLFNFAKYVEWPFPAPDAPITIGVAGRSTCVEYLRKAIEAKRVSGRAIVVVQLDKAEKMRLDVYVVAARAAKLEISSKLLSVADNVIGKQ